MLLCFVLCCSGCFISLFRLLQVGSGCFRVFVAQGFVDYCTNVLQGLSGFFWIVYIVSDCFVFVPGCLSLS